MLPIKGIQKTSLVDFPPNTGATIFLGNCNFRCPFCQNPDLITKFNETETISETEIIEFLKSRKKWLDGVCITGGEPLLYELTEFLIKIKKIGMLIKLDTNGTNPERLKELIEKKTVDYVAMDIKSSIEGYDESTKIKTDIEKIKKSVDILKSNKVDYEFRMTVVPSLHSEEDFRKIGEWLKGSKRFFIQQFNTKNCLDKDFEKIKPYPKERLEIFRDILKKYIKEAEIRGV